MNAKILNRSTAPPEDGWYQIEVTGLHAAGPKRQQLIDEQAMETIVTRFQAEREAEGDSWMGMLVDIDHHSHDLSKTTEAWAWLQDLEVRDGQLHGKLDLTDLGEAAILNKRVKRFSTNTTRRTPRRSSQVSSARYASQASPLPTARTTGAANQSQTVRNPLRMTKPQITI